MTQRESCDSEHIRPLLPLIPIPWAPPDSEHACVHIKSIGQIMLAFVRMDCGNCDNMKLNANMDTWSMTTDDDGVALEHGSILPTQGQWIICVCAYGQWIIWQRCNLTGNPEWCIYMI